VQEVGKNKKKGENGFLILKNA
jgi:hypothetical protein